MRYLLMIHTDEKMYENMTEAENGQLMQAYGEYYQALETAGVFVGSDRLQPVATATTVQVRDGKTLTTDGPFAETKEQLGGYYLINVDNLDDAIGWAAKIPCATQGSIEVRPIWESETCAKSDAAIAEVSS